MRLLVCGSRTMAWRHLDMVRAEIDAYKPTEVVHGNAAGADMLAMEVCRQQGIPYRAFDPDWKKYGKAAGPIRNQQMLETKPDQVLAFFPKAGITRGTADMVARAVLAGIPVKEVPYDK